MNGSHTDLTISFNNACVNVCRKNSVKVHKQRWANAVRAGPSELGPGIDPDLTVFLVRLVLNHLES